MKKLSADDVFLVYDDFFENKISHVQDMLAFRLYESALREMWRDLTGICKGTGETPLVEALEDADGRHDSGARAAHGICRALIQLKGLPEAQRRFLIEVKKTFVPSIEIVKKGYEEEAAQAKRRLGDLEAMEQALKAFPIGPDMSLYTLVSLYLEAGSEIDDLLSSRADAEQQAEQSRTKHIYILRSKAIGLLGKFREVLAHEVSENPDLPRDLEETVFAYYDKLSEIKKGRGPKNETEGEPEQAADDAPDAAVTVQSQAKA